MQFLKAPYNLKTIQPGIEMICHSLSKIFRWESKKAKKLELWEGQAQANQLFSIAYSAFLNLQKAAYWLMGRKYVNTE